MKETYCVNKCVCVCVVKVRSLLEKFRRIECVKEYSKSGYNDKTNGVC